MTGVQVSCRTCLVQIAHHAFKTPEEVAELLRVHRTTIYRLIDSGEIKATRIGGQWRISESALTELLGNPPVEIPEVAS